MTIARYVNLFSDQYSYFERIDHLLSDENTTFGDEFLILQLPDYNQVGVLRWNTLLSKARRYEFSFTEGNFLTS
jgi:hypothetical protein